VPLAGDAHPCHTFVMPRSTGTRKSRTATITLNKAAEELTAIAVRHLNTLQPPEREARIGALESRFPAKKRSSSFATTPRREQTPESRLVARGRDE